MKQFLNNEDEDKKFIEKHRLGKGSRGGDAPLGCNSRVVSGRVSYTKGVRKSGGGVKHPFQAFFPELEHWVEYERLVGHRIYSNTIFMHWCMILHRERLAILDKGDSASKKEKQLAGAVSARFAKWRDSESYRKTAIADVLRKIGASSYKPQRVTSLDGAEEKLRARLTWQSFDSALHLAAFGTADELTPFVAKPENFVRQRHGLVLTFSDQIPFWVKIGSGNQIYARNEKISHREIKKRRLQAVPQRQIAADCDVHALTDVQQEALSDIQPEALTDVQQEVSALAQAESVNTKGNSYKVQQGDHQDDRFRITYEPLIVVEKYFSENVQDIPVSSLRWASIVIPGSTWGKLSNISDDHKFIKDEFFIVAGKPVERKAGQSAGKLFHTYVELRKKKPELFVGLDYYIQPAGNVDTIIYTWQEEVYSSRLPGGVRQKDLFAGGLTPHAKLATALASELEAYIAGQMTARLQLVDTNFAMQFKAHARSCKQDLAIELQLLAAATQRAPDYSCGALEICRIVKHSHDQMKRKILEENSALPALRRNGHLAYRPDFSKGCLVRVDDLEWGKAYPLGKP